RWPRRTLSKAASLKKHVTNVESLALWLRNRIGRKGKTAGQLPAREAERRGTGPRRGLRVYRPELSGRDRSSGSGLDRRLCRGRTACGLDTRLRAPFLDVPKQTQ